MLPVPYRGRVYGAVAALLLALLIFRLIAFTDADLVIDSGPSVFSADRHLLRVYLNSREQLLIPIKLEKVHGNIINAVVAAEDKRFYGHHGVDPLALGRAISTNIQLRKVKSGASTVTMQVCRLLSPADRTLLSKAIEMIRAIQLEWKLEKNEILSLYLNLLPFGSNIVGIETASRIYFNKSSDNLTVDEAALLAGLPKNPIKFNPLKHPDRAISRRNFVLKRMLEEKMLSREEYDKYVKVETIVRRYPLPFLAPHFCEMVLSQLPAPSSQLNTTLRLDFQRSLESIISQYLPILKNQNINNVCAVVLDNKTGGILAYAGSQDYFDPASAGQVQGPLAIRSPGSTLKSFLYLMNIDKGDLTPSVKLVDVPTHYVGLDPENFNRECEGMVTAADALHKSLNVPAVRLLNSTGMTEYKEFLEKCGLQHLDKKAEHYGLGLVLGSCGVTLMELTNAYASIARGGIYMKEIFETGGEKTGIRIFSAETAYLISEILKVEEGIFDDVWFSYKTGTSANHKDAWCIGYNPEITIGIWAGNFNGESSIFLTGRTVAVPMVRSLFKAMAKDKAWFARPIRVAKRKVCAVSGLVPTELCGDVIDADYIANQTKNKSCDIHRKIFVTADNRYSFCSGCMENRQTVSRVVESYPPEVTRFLQSRGMLPGRIPPHFPDCAYHRTIKTELKILEPLDGSSYLSYENSRIPVRIGASQPNQKLFLFLDDVFLRTIVASDQVFLDPIPGRHTLQCLDETGNSVAVTFVVE